MTSAEIRKSFLDFFREKNHTIVPSASLLPSSPNLLFTNAGMNQFVPIFLGEQAPNLGKWAGAEIGSDRRAADTQKCIRAGGKHNDLEEVGLDTYHHTFFEMLGNWSFGDYFKAEAIKWAWELVVERWGFPPKRLYATVYKPSENDPGEFDLEAHDHWAALFRSAGLDPRVHIIHGNKKDNFWMMGDTGPCGPCSELHVDLTPAGDTQGRLVNAGDARCIEIWNLVFIQYNANADGTFVDLPEKHVDTGMGFERVTSIIQGTKRFSDFENARISNYETDIFHPLFEEIGRLCGLRYASTLPKPGSTGDTAQERNDVAFRVIADHIRTLSFAIADGIHPGNSDRSYVLRRILRRAVRYGRNLGFREPFFYKLVPTLERTMGRVFPELTKNLAQVQDILQREELAFHKTLDKGLALFEEVAQQMQAGQTIPGTIAFKLYDEQGFPLDLTQLLARERALSVDEQGFEAMMQQQRTRARASQKKKTIELSQIETKTPTHFCGYNTSEVDGQVLEVVALNEGAVVVLDRSVFYAELGGQVGDSGVMTQGQKTFRVLTTQKSGDVWLHHVDGHETPSPGDSVHLAIDLPRRRAIERHHTATHLLHWALHEVIGPELTQKGSYVGPDKLTFDFNSAPLTPSQIRDVERVVNERIVENGRVSDVELPYNDVRNRHDVLQFFGDKYGDTVRVVQIGGVAQALDGYSMELCGGTHTRATGEIGLFRILSEVAVAAGIRRIEAVAGMPAYATQSSDAERLRAIAALLNAPLGEIEAKIEALIAQRRELEKTLKAYAQRQAAADAKRLLEKAEPLGSLPSIIANYGEADAETLQCVIEALKSKFEGVIVLASAAQNSAFLAAAVSSAYTQKIQAGKIIQHIAPVVDGRGGGKAEFARGAGKNVSKIAEALEVARRFVADAMRAETP